MALKSLSPEEKTALGGNQNDQAIGDIRDIYPHFPVLQRFRGWFESNRRSHLRNALIGN